MDEQLTVQQRQVFVALVLSGVPLDALVVELGSSRNAIYKSMFDARRKLRAALVANGYLPTTEGGAHDRPVAAGTFPAHRPARYGLRRAMEILHIYAELVAAGEPAEERYPGVAAHLRACGPCGDDCDGLLAALAGEAT